MSVPDNILLLLFCGVGIYSPYNQFLCPIYNSAILEYASNGRLAYIVADNSISFGTNYPVSRIMIEKNFSDTYSIYTMFQLLGRAGRVGKSSTATAYVSNELASNIIEFTTNPDKYDIENNNICDMIELQENERKLMVADKIASLQADMMEKYNVDTKVEITIVNNGGNIKTLNNNSSGDTKQETKTNWKGEDAQELDDWDNESSSDNNVVPETKTNWRNNDSEDDVPDNENNSVNNVVPETKTNWKNNDSKDDVPDNNNDNLEQPLENKTSNIYISPLMWNINNRSSNYKDNNRTNNYRDNRSSNYKDNISSDYKDNNRNNNYRDNNRTTRNNKRKTNRWSRGD
jgi:hypothetical protein